MNLRPYQHKALVAIEAAFAAEQRSVLAVLATGLGKTVLFSHLADRHPGRVLVLAHRDELIQQAKEKLEAVCREEVTVEMGLNRARRSCRLVVSSVQTLSRPGRQERFSPEGFGLLVIDEAHHAVARTYRSVIDFLRSANPNLNLLGVTATPNRSDSLALGQVFEHVAYDYGIESAVSDGWLVPVLARPVVVEGLDFSRARSLAGDFNERDLEQILADEKMLHSTAKPAVELAGRRPTLVFCVTVAHARGMAAVIDRYAGEGMAVALDGTTDPRVRADEVAAFKAGRRQYLCNCGLFLEGFDAPATSCVVMARPTKSLALYAQVLGRGTRPLPGVVDGCGDSPAERRAAIASSRKPDVVVLDFVGNSGRHKIVSAVDLLGGRYDEPTRAYARQTSEEEGRAVDVDESLERARDELALLEEIRERKRRAFIRADVEYHVRDADIFGRDGGPPPTVGSAVSAPLEQPSDKQVWYLVHRAGWTERAARLLSKKAASAIIGKHREKEGAA